MLFCVVIRFWRLEHSSMTSEELKKSSTTKRKKISGAFDFGFGSFQEPAEAAARWLCAVDSDLIDDE